jgi:hypothetical protein
MAFLICGVAKMDVEGRGVWVTAIMEIKKINP